MVPRRKHPGMCRTVDDILFKKPVEIGALLFLTSQVISLPGVRLVLLDE